MTGTLYGIGVGPGAPDLLTLRAVALLGRLPVLAWPAPPDGAGMARTIAAAHIPAETLEIPIRLSFRPERDDTDGAYGAAAEAIAGHLVAGRDVGVLCEGDPLFFGSFIHLLDRLSGRFAVQVVPGLSSPMAAAAMAVRPLAQLEEAVAVLPATRPDHQLEPLLNAADSAVILKVGRHLPRLKALLARLDLLAHAVAVERATLAGQRIAPLAEVDELSYFSLVLVRR